MKIKRNESKEVKNIKKVNEKYFVWLERKILKKSVKLDPKIILKLCFRLWKFEKGIYLVNAEGERRDFNSEDSKRQKGQRLVEHVSLTVFSFA